MEVLKLSVDYDGYYGGSIHEYCLLPIDWNGLYTHELSCGTEGDAIYLGEIEGKHSEVYGDLTVEVVDLSKLNKRQLSELIKGSSVGEFEGTFEGWEEDFDYEIEEEEEEARKLKQSEFEKLNGIKFKSKYEIKSVTISENLISKLSGQLEEFAEITIKASDLHKATIILQDYEIETFN